MRLGLTCLLVALTRGVEATAAQAALFSGTQLDRAFYQMYDLDFQAAHQTLAEWMGRYPEDPMGPVADAAAYLFEQLDRLRILQSELFVRDEAFLGPHALMPDAGAVRSFRTQVAKAEQLSAGILARDPRNTNALFALVLVHGLRSDHEGLIEKSYLASLSAAKLGRQTAEKLLAIDPTFHDAWMAIGVENYLLSLKPLPLRWLLQLNGNQVDRQEGVRRLRLAAEGGRFLKPFARLLLAVAALRENDRDTARDILRDLRKQFPRNRLYAEELARLE